MKETNSAFAGHSIKINLFEWIGLLFGRAIKRKWSAIRIGLWKMPDNGCPCEDCSKIFKRKK